MNFEDKKDLLSSSAEGGRDLEHKEDKQMKIADLLKMADDLKKELADKDELGGLRLEKAKLEVEGEAKKTEKEKRQEQMEQGENYALKSGELHFQQLVHPKEFEKDRDEVMFASPLQTGDYFMPELYIVNNDIRKGVIYDEFPDNWGSQELDRNEVDFRRPKNYAAALHNAFNKAIKKNNEDIGALIEERKRGEDAGQYIDLSTPEAIEKEISRLEQVRKNREEQMILSFQKHTEGFGLAALEEDGYLESAVRSLYSAKLLDDDKILEKIRGKLEELYKSSDPKDMVVADSVYNLLDEYSRAK